MTNYKVGYFVGSLSTSSINRMLAKALLRLAPAELDSPRSRSRICRCTTATTIRLSAGGACVQASDHCGCGAVRHAGVQPFDPRRLKNAIDWASRP